MSILLILLGIAALVAAVVALIRGRIRWLAISSRKIAVGVLAGGFGLLIAGGATAPQSTPALAGATVTPTTTTTTSAGPSTTAPPLTTTPLTTTTVPVTTTTQPPASTQPEAPVAPPGLDCTATVSDAHPHHNATTAIVVNTAAGAQVDVLAHYKTTTHEKVATASGGHAKISYDVSTASYGFEVDVDITVSKGDQQGSCTTSFTPEG